MYCSKMMEMGSIYTVPCIMEKFTVLKVCAETPLLHLAENSHSMMEIMNLIVRDNCPFLVDIANQAKLDPCKKDITGEDMKLFAIPGISLFLSVYVWFDSRYCGVLYHKIMKVQSSYIQYFIA